MTEISMIERVGRAIAEVQDEDYMEDWRRYDVQAKAAIAAMRDPTSDMKQAMTDAEGDSLGLILTTPLSKVYRAAIETALLDKPATT